MRTLDQALRNNAYYCGLPDRFQVQLRVLQYAQCDISAEEYAEFYSCWSNEYKILANIMIEKITLATYQKERV